MIQSLIKNEDAPLTHGLPSISSELEWLPQLFVSGGLADLELGPFARNIMGGRSRSKIKQAYKRLSAQPIQKHA